MVSVGSQIVIGIAGVIIAWFQYQLSKTQGQMLAQQQKLTASITELHGEVKTATKLIGDLTVIDKEGKKK